MTSIESVQQYLKFLKENLAEVAAASVETGVLVVQIAETLPAVTRTLAEILTRLDTLDTRLNRYISDQAKQEGKIARQAAHISEVRRKLGLGSAGNGG